MVYDAANLPTALGRSGSYVQYLYDPLNRKARQSTATDMTYYLGDGYERAGAPQYSGAHRHELGPLVVTVQSRSTGNNADVYYELRDRLGSAIAVVDDRNTTTNAIEHREYDAFGAVREAGTLIPGLNYGVVTAHGFTDQEHIDAVKLIPMNGRVYDYTLGRFLSAAPIVPDISSAESFMQGLGFQPTRLFEQQKRNSALKNYEQQILDRRQTLMNAYAMAVRAGDDRDVAMERIHAFNAQYPEIAIKSESLRQSLRARARYSSEQQGGVAVNKKLRPRLGEMTGLGA